MPPSRISNECLRVEKGNRVPDAEIGTMGVEERKK
jgi:hypothetical protein